MFRRKPMVPQDGDAQPSMPKGAAQIRKLAPPQFDENDENEDKAKDDLIAAIKNSDFAATIKALNAGAKLDFFDSKTRDGPNTPLTIACRNQQKEIAELLIMRGASLEQNDRNGKVPLQYAQGECVQLLLQHKATADVRDNNGNTPLMCDLMAGVFDNIPLLLEHKANPTLCNYDGKSVLQMATDLKSSIRGDTPWFDLITEAIKKYDQTPRPG